MRPKAPGGELRLKICHNSVNTICCCDDDALAASACRFRGFALALGLLDRKLTWSGREA